MTTTCDTSLGCLLDLQQSDGGWAYSTNASWTEPTCYSIMALRAARGPEQAIGRACEWLARRQRRDGGWSPGPAVEKSTHVTSLALLALSEMTEYEKVADHGVSWVLAQAGAETSLLSKLTRLARGTRSAPTDHAGWPWYPGEAAWVIPTSLGICALSRQRHGKFGGQIPSRLDEARRFLLSRRCPDSGWNHGGQFRPDETPASYPETTGMALLALRGLRAADLERSIHCAEQHTRNPKSGEGANWLYLGLRAQGRMAAPPETRYRDWTVNQVALRIIAQSAGAGRNPFIDYE